MDVLLSKRAKGSEKTVVDFIHGNQK